MNISVAWDTLGIGGIELHDIGVCIEPTVDYMLPGINQKTICPYGFYARYLPVVSYLLYTQNALNKMFILSYTFKYMPTCIISF